MNEPRPTLEIRREEITSEIATSLIGALNAELAARYPEEGATHFRLDAQEVAPGRGAFLVAWLGDTSVGCGAVRRIDAGTAEVKRMYVAPTVRGSGVGRALLEEIERQARLLGVATLQLETGIRQEAAIALYRSAGFTDIPPYGEYVDSPLSICLAKRIVR